jgi:EAL domain-containing protein (putative c-di-GMP-specific phosphodiesterase class I)/GGDEF domain-containing protein
MFCRSCDRRGGGREKGRQIVVSRDSKNRYVAFAFARGDILLEIDSNGIIVFATGSVRALLGIDADALIAKGLNIIVSPESAPALGIVLSAAKTGRRVLVDIVLQIGARRANGNIAGCPLPDGPGYYLSFSAQLGASRETQGGAARIPVEAPRDAATGLLSRDALTAQAEKLLGGTPAGSPPPKLTLVDVSGAGSVMDKLPPEKRKAVQRELGDTLKKFSVANDSAAVLGDDKFGLVHDAAIDPSAIQRGVADVLKRAAPAAQNVGVVLSSLELDRSGLSQNDTAKALVYAVNRFVDASPGEFTMASLKDVLGKELDTAMTKMADFRRFIDEDGFQLFFQPIVALGDRVPHHQEALTRLPDGSSPFSTVTFAEEIGLITDLDYSVAQKVLALLERQPNALDVAMNLSGRSLENPAFVSVMLELLARYPGLRHRLMIEVTESSRIKNLEKVGKVIQSFRTAGHRVCIDDFGAGSAALQYLRFLNVDVIKIDGLYVREISTNPNDRILVKAIQFLCKELKCESVAEMIEDDGQAKLLRELGVQFGQGYLYAKPSAQIYSQNRARLADKPQAAPIAGRSRL